MRPLVGLDGVAWASLHGTHRSAEHVPEQLEALRSPDSDARHEALNKLWDAVEHQGTRWQVSAHVVPFLAQLVDHPATPDRGALTKLLRHVRWDRVTTATCRSTRMSPSPASGL